jgi:type II secretory pathway component GspD/PulD (secretin)
MWMVAGFGLLCGLTAIAQDAPSGVIVEQPPDHRPVDPDHRSKLKLRIDPDTGMVLIEGAPGDVSNFDFWYRNLVEDWATKGTAQKHIKVFRLQHIDVTFAASLLTEMFNDQRQQAARNNRNNGRNNRANERGGGRRGRNREPEPEPEPDRRADAMGGLLSGRGDTELNAAISALSGQQGIRVVPNKQQNTLIIRARSEEFPGIIQLLNKIDRPGGKTSEYEIVNLINISADEAKTMVEQLLGLTSTATTASRRQPQRNQQNRNNRRGGRNNNSGQAERIAAEMANQEVRLSGGAAFDKSEIRISSMPATNSVVVMGPQEARAQVVEIIRALDEEGEDSMVESFVLEKADADGLAKALSDAYSSSSGGSNRRGATTTKTVSITANTNTNTIYVVSPPHLRSEIIARIAEAEQKADQLVTPRVIQVLQGDAEIIADKLKEVFESRGTRGGKSKIMITGDKATNQLFVIAPNDIFTQIEQLAASMDRADSDQITARHFKLNHAAASDVKERMVDMVMMLARSLSSTKGGLGDMDLGGFAVMDDPRTNSLIVMGNQKTFVIVDQAIAAIDIEPPDNSRRLTKTIQLSNADARQVADNIKRLFTNTNRDGVEPPKAEANEAINAIIIEGTTRQVARIEAEVIKPLEELSPPQETRETEVFALTFAESGNVARAINDTFGRRGSNVPEKDKVTAVAESGTQSVVVTASVTQMDHIRGLITELDRDTGSQVRETYTVQNTRAGDIADVISRQLQGTRRRNVRGQMPVNVVADENTNNLIISGSRKDVDELKTLIVELDVKPDADRGRFIKVYNLKYANLWSVNDAINRSFNTGRGMKESDRVNAALDWETGSLIITANVEKHIEIEKLLGDIDKESGSVRSFEVLKLENGDASEVASTLEAMIRQQRTQRGQTPPSVTADASTNSLIVYASESEMANFQPLIDSMNKEGAAANTPQRITLQHANAASLADLLNQVFGESANRGGRRRGSQRQTPVIIADDATNTLIVRAQEKDFQEIQKMVTDLDVENETGPGGLRIIQVAQGINVTDLAQIVEQTIRQGEDYKKQQDRNYRPKYVAIGSDPRTSALLVSGAPAMFDEVEKTIRALEKMKPAGPANVRMIKLGNMSADEIKAVLDQIIEGRESSNPSSNRRSTGNRNNRGGGNRGRRR